ncbi:MAG: hypothetical protein D6E12_11700 [Desulfovibrio sp.]|nr:MAG: hypothetical protein D6E12_11700 [Desulfovibrio sp.]
MKANFFQAVVDVAEIMKFESWLRFYFLVEEDNTLYMRLSDQAQERIKEAYPHLAPLVEQVKDTAVTYENSVNTVCTFVASSLDGSKYAMGTVNEVFGSPEFQTEMQLFHIWTQAHEDQLDQGFVDFNNWNELFEKWKNSPEVKEHLKSQGNNVKVLRCDNETMH